MAAPHSTDLPTRKSAGVRGLSRAVEKINARRDAGPEAAQNTISGTRSFFSFPSPLTAHAQNMKGSAN